MGFNSGFKGLTWPVTLKTQRRVSSRKRMASL